MNSMALTGLGTMDMIREPDPVIKKETDVMVRVSHVGVCGSDMHLYEEGHIGDNWVEYPCVVGHEGTGIIEEVGSGVKHVRAGDRIAIEPAQPCGGCDQCRAGRPHTCRNLKFLGSPGQAAGILSERIIIPGHCCFPLPDHLPNDRACLAEPLSISIWAVDLSGISADASIAILGSGPIGMCALLYARHLGVRNIYVTDPLDDRLVKARKAGATWTGNPDKEDIAGLIHASEPLGLDCIFDCCGKQEAMDQAVELLKPGGKIMIVGIPEFDNWSFATDKTRRKEACIQNVRRQNGRLQLAIDLIAAGNVDTDQLVTHRFAFPRTGEAFALVNDYGDGVMKALIEL
jgi:L-iditol 2-dehydrogenase